MERRRGSRPRFAAMLADAESGAFDAIIVHKLDRFSRSVIVALETLHLLESLHVGFVSISEQMDFTTPIGEVILTTLSAFAEYYSANLSAETRKGKAERKRQGIYNGCSPSARRRARTGFPSRTRQSSWPCDGVRDGRERRTDRDVAQALNDDRLSHDGQPRERIRSPRTPFARCFKTASTLASYPDGQGGWIAGKHAPMIDAALFDAATAARFRNIRRRHNPGHADRSPWALSGVATCGVDRRMRRKWTDRSTSPRRMHRARQGLECDAPSFFADVIEDQIGGVLTHFALPERRARS